MYKKILVPMDGSELAESVLPHVKAISGGCSVNEVVLIRIIEPIVIPHSAMIKSIMRDSDLEQVEHDREKAANEYLDRVIAGMDLGVSDVNKVVLKGQVAETIGKYAEDNGVDLIVISTHGRSGITRWVMGSVAERVLRSSCVPVLMVRAPGCIPGM